MPNQDLVTKVDLHTHSTASDGKDSPPDLVRRALEQGIRILSITDHDALAGYASIKDYSSAVTVIPGIELSVFLDPTPYGFPRPKDKPQELHALGYDVRLDNDNLNQELEKNRARRHNRLSQIVSQLNIRLRDERKPVITPRDLAELRKSYAPGRTHLANLLVRKNISPDENTAFKQYLLAFDMPKRQIPFDMGSRLLQGAVGIVVLAHPYGKSNDSLTGITTDLNEQARIIEDLARKGLIQGLECYYPDHQEASPNGYITGAYLKMCEEFKLIPTGGSDHHGGKNTDRLGKFYVPDAIGQGLLERLKR